MTGQFGSDMLLEMGDGGSPEAFDLLAGLTSKSLSVNGGEGIDISDADSSNKWLEALPGGTIKTLASSGEGLFKDLASQNLLFDKIIPVQVAFNARLILPAWGSITSPWLLSSLELTGGHQEALTFSYDIKSIGEPTIVKT